MAIATTATFIAGGFSANAAITIDAFTTYQTLSAAGPPLGPKDAFGVISDAAILGTERDVWLSRTSGNAGSVSVDVNGSFSDAVAYASSPATAGYSLISYDGTDGLSGINYVGLGGIDLTQAGANTGIAFGTTSDLGATLTFTIYTDSTHYSSYNVPVAADSNFVFVSSFAKFSEFTAEGPSGGANFVDVGAITLRLDGTSTPGTDIGVNYVVATVPEPSGALLVLTAGLALLLRRRGSF